MRVARAAGRAATCSTSRSTAGAPPSSKKPRMRHSSPTSLGSDENRFGRVGVRIHDFSHPHWRDDVRIVLRAARAPPTSRSRRSPAPPCRRNDRVHRSARAAARHRAADSRRRAGRDARRARGRALAALPTVGTLSFGLMDFVSAHHGAIPDSAMRSPGQFEHRSCAARSWKSPRPATRTADAVAQRDDRGARHERRRRRCARARRIRVHADVEHPPAQIRPIVDAFAPRTDEVALAAEILLAAQAADWDAPR